ncbi:DinB family protein [Pseudalkalibacillus sp. A8]|uniref:DinB family protein n=1 Tax=Pseudalkalibacillus sp. A8 TaxID=3382641 RepID=UPI0038B54B59
MKKEEVKKYVHIISSRIDEFLSLIQKQDEKTINWKPSDEEWSIKEVLCHVEEVNRYWLQELERIVRNPEMKWGRGLNDPERLNAVSTAGHRDRKKVIDEINEFKTVIHERLLNLDDRELMIEAEHRNPKFGIRKLSFLLDHFMVEHLEKHIEQVNRNLKKYQKEPTYQ